MIRATLAALVVVLGALPASAQINPSPEAFDVTVESGSVVTQTLTLQNAGDEAVSFSITAAPALPPSPRAGLSWTPSASPRGRSAYDEPRSAHGRPANATGPQRIGARGAGSGRLFAVDFFNSSIVEIDPVTGAQLNAFDAPTSVSGGPEGLAYDGESLYYLAPFDEVTIYKLNPEDGSVLGTSSPALAADFDALAHSGTQLYGLNYGTGTVYAVDFDAATTTTVFTVPGTVGGMSFGGSRGTLFITEGFSTVLEVDPTDGTVLNSFGTSSTFYGLGYSNALGVLFGSGQNEGVIALDPDTGEVLYSFGSVGISGVAADEAAGVPWLAFEPQEGTIPAGGSAEVEVMFDATTLFAGDYAASIDVWTGDGSTAATILASLTVTGEPNIALDPTVLAFGEVVVGATEEASVTVTNTGTDVLTVSGVTSDDPSVSVTDEGFTLEPEASATLAVTFAPESVGPIEAQIAFSSDDADTPEAVVTVTGTGAEAPAVSVAPESLDVMIEAGDTTVQTLTVSNTGGSALSFTIGEQATVTRRSRQPVVMGTRPVATSAQTNGSARSTELGQRLEYRASGGSQPRILYFSDLSVRVPEDVVSGLDVDVTLYVGLYDVFVADLQSETWDLVIFESGDLGWDVSPLVEYTEAGGRLLFTYWDADQAPDLVAALGAEVVLDTFEPQTVYDWLGHPAFTAPNEVETLIPGGDFFNDNGDEFVATEGQALGGFAPEPEGASAAVVLGNDGRTLLNGFIYVDYVGIDENENGIDDIAEFVENQILFLVDEVTWLSADPDAGTVPAGESVEVDVLFDATDLVAGEFEASLVVASDDPVTPAMTVPVTMVVTGAPAIAVDPVDLDFGEVYVGYQESAAVAVTNIGTDSLTVSGATADGSGITVEEFEAFTLAPGASQTITVTVSPEEPMEIDGTVLINSDDPNAPTYVITVTADAVEAPVVAVTPSTLSALLEPGEMATQTVEIMNSGGADLSYAIVVSEARLPRTPGPAVQGKPAGSYEPHASTPVTPRVGGGEDIAVLVIQDTEAWGLDLALLLDEQFGIEATVISSTQIGSTDFNAYDLVITVGDEFSDYYERISDNDVKFATYAASGGTVLYQLATQGDDVALAGGAQIVYVGGDNLNYTAADHPIVEGLSDPLEGNSANHTVLTNLPDDALVITTAEDQATPTTVEYALGAGRVVATGMTWEFLYTYGFETGALLTNALNYVLGLSATAWLSISPEAGTVASGATEDLTVTFDASTLGVGTYEAQLVIQSNDPAMPTVSIPVTLEVVITKSTEEEAVPMSFALHSPYPNPFVSTASVAVDVPEAAVVRLALYDTQGRRVAALVDGPLAAGRHTVTVDGRTLPSGLYFCRMQAGTFTATTKVLLVR